MRLCSYSAGWNLVPLSYLTTKGSGKWRPAMCLGKTGEGVCWTASDAHVESQKEDQEPRPP